VQTKFVSLTSSPDTTDAQGNYTLTFTIGDKIIPMSKHDTQERNKQATEALIETLETIEEEECTQIQACLQKALESCSNPQECVKILRNIFYKRGPEISPHPTIISLIDPSLMQITENYTHLGAHKLVLCKMIEAYADIDNQEDSNNQDIQDISDQEDIIAHEHDERTHAEEQVQAEQPAQLEQAQPETIVQEAPAPRPQRSRYNPLGWFGL